MKKGIKLIIFASVLMMLGFALPIVEAIYSVANYNDDLSKRRCNKALKVLVKEYGIDKSRFEIQPNGKRSLLFPKHHANRRVDFSVIQ